MPVQSYNLPSLVQGHRQEPFFTATMQHADQPAYRATEAAAILSLPVATVKTWAFGQRYISKAGVERKYQPLIKAAAPKDRLISFTNLCELHVLAAIRRVHRIDMQNVRRSLNYVSGQLGVERALVAQDFLTNGIDLFVEKAGLINVSREGQTALRGELEAGLQRIERDAKGGLVRLFPFTRLSASTDQPRSVALDPRIAFGRPVLLSAGVTTQVINDRFLAGDSFAEMAEDFHVSVDDIAEAVRFENRLAA